MGWGNAPSVRSSSHQRSCREEMAVGWGWETAVALNQAHWKRKTRKADGEKLWLGVEKSAPLCSSPWLCLCQGRSTSESSPTALTICQHSPPQNACGIHKPPCGCVTETVEEEMGGGVAGSGVWRCSWILGRTPWHRKDNSQVQMEQTWHMRLLEITRLPKKKKNLFHIEIGSN